MIRSIVDLGMFVLSALCGMIVGQNLNVHQATFSNNEITVVYHKDLVGKDLPFIQYQGNGLTPSENVKNAPHGVVKDAQTAVNIFNIILADFFDFNPNKDGKVFYIRSKNYLWKVSQLTEKNKGGFANITIQKQDARIIHYWLKKN